jgi:predicted dienelactone hydrolase
LLPAVLGFFLACGPGKPDLPKMIQELSAPGEFGVGRETATFRDQSRPTDKNGEYPGDPSRTLVTEIWYPIRESTGTAEIKGAPLAGGTFPLVVFCHGFMGNRRQSVIITSHLASHGYIVASPDFPLSNTFAPGGPTSDLVNQPADVSFLIDSLLGFSSPSGNRFSEAIDEKAIGVSGHSLGGGTTIMTVFGSNADPRIKAAAPLAPFSCLFGDEFYSTGGVPIIFISGSRDIFTRFTSNASRSYNLVPPPRYLAKIAGGTHIGFTDLDIPETSELTQVMFGLSPNSEMVLGFTQLIEVTHGNFLQCSDLFSSAAQLEAIPQIAGDLQRRISGVLLAGFFNLYLRNQEKYRDLLKEDINQYLPDLTLKWQEK